MDSSFSRRHLLLTASGLVGTGLLAACGAPTASVPSTSVPATAAPTTRVLTAVSASDTIAFSYNGLSATVPSNPQRVIVIEGRGDLDFALTAGYPVIATGNTFNPTELPSGPFKGRMDNVMLLGFTDKINYEQLTMLHPDMIINRANAVRGDFYGNDILSKIAPVLPVEVNRYTWRADLTEQAKLLKRDQQVNALLKTYDDKVTAARSEIGDLIKNRKVAFMTVNDPVGVLVWRAALATEVANDLGMQQPFRDTTKPDDDVELSAELLSQLNTIDLLIRQGNTPSADTTLDATATWKALPAVQASHIYVLNPTFNNGLAITATALIDELVAAAKLLAS